MMVATAYIKISGWDLRIEYLRNVSGNFCRPVYVNQRVEDARGRL
jgi:hypothetical protein